MYLLLDVCVLVLLFSVQRNSIPLPRIVLQDETVDFVLKNEMVSSIFGVAKTGKGTYCHHLKSFADIARYYLQNYSCANLLLTEVKLLLLLWKAGMVTSKDGLICLWECA